MRMKLNGLVEKPINQWSVEEIAHLIQNLPRTGPPDEVSSIFDIPSEERKMIAGTLRNLHCWNRGTVYC